MFNWEWRCLYGEPGDACKCNHSFYKMEYEEKFVGKSREKVPVYYCNLFKKHCRIFLCYNKDIKLDTGVIHA